MIHQKKAVVKLLIRSTMAVVLLGQTPAIAEPKNIRVVVEHWPPWEIAHDEANKRVTSGIAIDLLKEIMSRLSIPMELVTVPWKRALVQIEQGESDLIPMVAKTQERAKYMLFTDEVYIDPILLAYSKDRLKNFEWENWQDLKSYKFQIVRGYNYGKEWDQALKKYGYQHSTSTSDIQSLKMLKGGRIDLAPLFFVSGTMLIKEHGFENTIGFSSKSVNETVFYLGISKKSSLATRLGDINKEISKMRSDGSYERIFKDLKRN